MGDAMSELGGHVAMVTGGGRGIGEAVARRLAAAGAAVVVISRSQDEVESVAGQIVKEGGSARAFAADVTDKRAIEEICSKISRELGTIDILINNAAVIGPLGPFVTVDADAWEQACAVNLIAPVRLTRLLLPAMVARGWGRIVNVSTGAINYPTRDDTYNAYVATKSGFEAHTLNLSAQLAGTGVTINSFRPGVVETAMQQHIRSQDPGVVGEEFHQRFVKRYLDGKLLTPDVPATALFELLMSDQNGQIVNTPMP